jgi:hypothetical protein
MVNIRKISPMARAIGTVGAVVALAGGVTFAALTSTATLTDTSINTANAGLLLWNGTSFQPTAPGFTVTGQIPGTDSAPQAFYFQNSGDAAENITVKANHAPTSSLTSPSDLALKFSCSDGAGNQLTTNTDLQQIITAPVSINLTLPLGAQGDTGNPNTLGNCTVKFNINPGGVVGGSASVTDLDLDFTGTAVGS